MEKNNTGAESSGDLQTDRGSGRDWAPAASRAELARRWYARRRNDAEHSEFVLTTIGSLDEPWLGDLHALTHVGFKYEPTVLRLTQRDGACSYAVHSWREASGSPEVAVYQYLHSDEASEGNQNEVERDSLIRAMYSASDVLVAFCSAKSTETNEALREAQLLARTTNQSLRLIVLVNCGGLSNKNSDAISTLTDTSHVGLRAVMLNDADLQAENRWIKLLEQIEILLSSDLYTSDSAPNAPSSVNNVLDASAHSTLDSQIEAAVYSAAMTSSARRVVLYDGNETLLATHDLFDAQADWEECDQHIALRTAMFERDELRHLVLATADAVFTLDTAALVPGLRIGAYWNSQLDIDDVRLRARTLTATVEGELARIRERS